VRLVNADVILLLHALHQLLDQLIQRSFSLHLLQLFAQLLVQQVAFEQRAFNSSLKFVERLLVRQIVIGEIVMKSALQKIIRQRPEQILQAHFASRIGNVLAIADAFHGRWW
jgi:hypothetical protein